MITSRIEKKSLLETSQHYLLDISASLLEIITKPISLLTYFSDNLHDLVLIHQENVRLKHESEKLAALQTMFTEVEIENRLLKEQLHFSPDPIKSFLTARIIGDSGSTSFHTFLIHAGTVEGIKKGQAVLSGETLIGRITDVSHHASRIMLITDSNSHTPVMIERTREKAILVGDNSDQPRLSYLSVDDQSKLGDRIITSGHGGVFPPGLLVGFISSVKKNDVRVLPNFQRHKIEYVRVVNYNLPGILRSDEDFEEDKMQ